MVSEVSCLTTLECEGVRAWAWSMGLILRFSRVALHHSRLGSIYSSVTEGLGSADYWGQSGRDSPGSRGAWARGQ